MLNSPIDEIKNRLDIVEVIGGYIKLQKAGVNYRALCPFHSEKTPSLFVSPARQIWKCFGCLKGGNIFQFVMEIEGVEFGDALRILARKAGVELKRPSPELARWKTERTRLYEVCERACQFFEKQLQESKTGQSVKKYLLDRGLKQDSIKKWRVGYAPDTWQGLSDFLTSQGYKKEEVEKAGLEIKNEKGNLYDRFRGRIIFPVFDLNSQVVGFGGRIFQSQVSSPEGLAEAKYINTPQTLLYDKSRLLYGLDKAKVEIRKKDFCILVEGYTDAILCSQVGFENVVSVSGTALTTSQLQTLKRYSKNIYTAFDMDVAGDTATQRGIGLAQSQGFNIKVIVMPEDKDPADIILKDSKHWERLVRESKSILEFYFETAFSRLSKDGRSDAKRIEEKIEISKILLPVIKRIPNKIEQSHWLQTLAKRLEIKEEDLETELKKVKPEDSFSISPALLSDLRENLKETKPKRNKKDLLEERIIYLILKYPQYLNLIDKSYFPYFSQNCQEILKYLEQNPDLKSDSTQKQNLLKNKDLSPEFAESLNYLYLAAEVDYNPLQEEFDSEDLPRPEDEVKTCLQEIKNFEIKSELGRTSEQIKTAEANGDSKKVESLIQKFSDLSKKLFN